MKPSFPLLVVAAISLCVAVPAFAQFSDVSPSRSDAQAIAYTFSRGIVRGYADGTFRPDSSINRAEFAKISILMFWNGEQRFVDMCDSDHFDDVPRGEWFFHFICSAKDQGIVEGYAGSKTYGPGNFINVAEAAKMITKAFKIQTDEGEGPWYAKYVRVLAERHALPLNLPALDAPLTRGQLAEIVYRLGTNNTEKPTQTYDLLTRETSQTSGTRSSTVSTFSSSPQQEKTCQTPVFTKALVAPDRVSNIAPLGTPNRPGRTYIGFTQDLVDAGGQVSIYAPTDARLVVANWYLHPVDNRPMWSLKFDAGCGVTFLLAHVTGVVDKIKVVGPGAPGSSSGGLETNVPFTAGELIGTKAPLSSDLALDFVASNTKVTNQFANQARYTLLNHEPDSLHAMCPYDLFSPELRNAYEAKYGGTHGPFAGATCGQVSHDVLGTISGQWFVNQDSASGVSSGDNFGVNFTSFAEGVNGYARLLIDEGTDDKIHTYSDNPTYSDPATIRDSHCYQSDGASYHVYARLASPEIINIASGPGPCPDSFPNSGYKTLYR